MIIKEKGQMGLYIIADTGEVQLKVNLIAKNDTSKKLSIAHVDSFTMNQVITFITKHRKAKPVEIKDSNTFDKRIEIK